MNSDRILADIQIWPDERLISLDTRIIPDWRDHMAQWADARRQLAAGYLAAGELGWACDTLPHHICVGALHRWMLRGWVNRAEANAALACIWSSANPSFMPRSQVVALFRLVGYVADEGAPTTPPDDALVIYRGAVPEAKRGLSWTTDLKMAAFFARGYFARHSGVVYRATVWPGFVLARFGEREESEVVVDPAGLRRLVELPPSDWLHLVETR